MAYNSVVESVGYIGYTYRSEGEMPDPSTNTPQANGETPKAGETPQGNTQPNSFDEWLASQDDGVRSLLDGHTAPLKSALADERSQRKELAKQLKDLTGKLESNSEAAKMLAEVNSKLETTAKRAEFYEAAVTAGCTNLKLAWLAAQADSLTAEQVKAQYPQLFAKAGPTHAGNGSQGAPPKADMNTWIRRQAGKG